MKAYESKDYRCGQKSQRFHIYSIACVESHTFCIRRDQKKVMDAVEELGYSPDASGRTFRTGKKMMIGLVVPDITNSVFAALIEDVDDVISKQGYNLVISIQEIILEWKNRR